MMKSGAEPGTENRCELLHLLYSRDISTNTKVELTAYMGGRTVQEAEAIAKRLSAIVLKSNSEKEMLEEAARTLPEPIPEELWLNNRDEWDDEPEDEWDDEPEDGWENTWNDEPEDELE